MFPPDRFFKTSSINSMGVSPALVNWEAGAAEKRDSRSELGLSASAELAVIVFSQSQPQSL